MNSSPLDALIQKFSPPAAAASPLGTPPPTLQPPGGAAAAGGPPPLNPDAVAPQYDVATDPGWKGLIDPNNHPLRNLFNSLSPEERELLRAWKSVSAPGAVPPGVPSDRQQMMTAPLSTSRAPGTI